MRGQVRSLSIRPMLRQMAVGMGIASSMAMPIPLGRTVLPSTRRSRRRKGALRVSLSLSFAPVITAVSHTADSPPSRNRESRQLIDSTTRPCPRCEAPTHKYTGCNHMVCPRCVCRRHSTCQALPLRLGLPLSDGGACSAVKVQAELVLALRPEYLRLAGGAAAL